MLKVSVLFARKFVLGFCDNLFNFLYFLLNLGFSICPNFTKYKIAGIGILKTVNVALCGMKCLDLTKERNKELGVHISYN